LIYPRIARIDTDLFFLRVNLQIRGFKVGAGGGGAAAGVLI
jgi:hypothetical protein